MTASNSFPASSASGAALAPAGRNQTVDRIKSIMRRDLKLGDDIVIDETTPFVGGDADIDSLDVLMVLASVEREFGIRIGSEEMGKQLFQNVGTLADYLSAQMSGTAAAPAAPGAAVSNDELLARLPHAAPFRFVSALTSVEAGKSARGVWSVSGREDFFAGHFPGRPIVPGVLIAEALAQLSGLAMNVRDNDGRLAQVEIRFESAVMPPAEIELNAKFLRQMGSLSQYEVQALLGKKLVASGTITLGWSPAANAGVASPGAANPSANNVGAK